MSWSDSERSATTEVVQLLGQRMPFPDYFCTQGPVPIPVEHDGSCLFSLFSEEPHRVTSNDLVGAVRTMPAEWLAALSHDVATR